MRLLLVEDERHLSDAIAHLLKAKKYIVDCCYDGEAGLEYGLRGIYDLSLIHI